MGFRRWFLRPVLERLGSIEAEEDKIVATEDAVNQALDQLAADEATRDAATTKAFQDLAAEIANMGANSVDVAAAQAADPTP